MDPKATRRSTDAKSSMKRQISSLSPKLRQKFDILRPLGLSFFTFFCFFVRFFFLNFCDHHQLVKFFILFSQHFLNIEW